MRLAEWMKLNSVSQAELARKLDVTESMVSLVISHQRRFSPSLAKKIVEESKGKVSLEELLFPDNYESKAV